MDDALPFCELRSAFHRNATCIKLYSAVYNFLMTLLSEGELSAATSVPPRRKDRVPVRARDA